MTRETPNRIFLSLTGETLPKLQTYLVQQEHRRRITLGLNTLLLQRLDARPHLPLEVLRGGVGRETAAVHVRAVGESKEKARDDTVLVRRHPLHGMAQGKA